MSNEHSPNWAPTEFAPSTDETPARPRYETGAHLLMCPLVCPPRNEDNFINVVSEYRSEVDKYLGSATPFQDELRTVVLYSSGVTGKTTLAVHYAVTRSFLIGTRFILWVDCGDIISLKRSFSDIAAKLQLPGYDSRDHDTNRDLGLDYLQDTNFSWIIIYDDVTSFDLIKHYWPDETCDGRAIITTKSDALGLGSFSKLPSLRPEAFIEVKAIDVQQKSIDETIRDLLKIEAHLPIGSTLNYSNDEKEDVYHLCSRLEGNMQEMIIMGALLGRNIYTIEAMGDYFERFGYQPNDHHSPVWPLVFKSLSSNSRSLLSTIAFLHGEMGIHLDLFRTRPLPEDMAWCKNDAELRTAVQELSDLFLISLVNELHLVGISHTTQTNFLKWLGEEGVSVSLERATKLLHGLHHAQIRENVEKQSMIDYNFFVFCLPHVRSLKDKFRTARQSSPMIKGSRELCELLVGCARYMLHEGFLSEVLDMIEVHQLAFGSLPPDRQSSLNPTNTLYLKWRVHIHRGEKEEALQTAIKIHDVYGWILSQEARVSEGSSYLMALSYISTGNYSKGLEWFWRVSDAWRANVSGPPRKSRDSRPLPPILMAQEGWACLLLNDLDSAKPLLEAAHEYIKPEHQYDPEATSTTEFVNFHLAKLRIREKNFADAKEKLLTAQSCIRKYPLQEFSQFHASYLYYLALCEMESGNLQQARTYIDSTARITRIYQDEMPMEHARCLHMLAEISSRQPPQDESVTHEARLAANLLILKHVHAGGDADVRHIAFETEAPLARFEEALAEKIFCLWR